MKHNSTGTATSLRYHAEMTHSVAGRPEPGEFAEWQAGYIAEVSGADPVAAIERSSQEAMAFLRSIDESTSARRYAEGKWSVKQVLGHVVDAERIFGCRLLRVARGDGAALPSFQQDDYAATARSDERSWQGLVDEFEALRRSHVFLFQSLAPGDWTRRGTVSGAPVSARALGFVLIGHEVHHRKILAERYLL